MAEKVLDISFPVDPDLEERIRGVLFLSDSDGDVTRDDGRSLTVTAFFSREDDRSRAAEELRCIPRVEVRAVDREETDWLARYQQSLEALLIGRSFIVAPDQSLITDPSRIPIIIPQERAFGTGSHASTALCLEMIERMPVAGSLCADVGTGSGILAIAMSRLGARRVIAFDNDVETFGVVHSNCRRNGLAPLAVLQYFGGPQALRPGLVDLAVMNILPEVIIQLLPDVALILRPGGVIIFSGIILQNREEVVLAAGEHGMIPREQSSEGEWWCGAFESAPHHRLT